jgi:hypothetical protein
MNAHFLSGHAAPADPFQDSRQPASDPAQALLARWLANTQREADRNAVLPDEWDEEDRRQGLFDERKEIGKAVDAIAAPSLTAAILKLRIIAWEKAVEEGTYEDGVFRTDPLTQEEAEIAEVIADLDRLAGRAQS